MMARQRASADSTRFWGPIRVFVATSFITFKGRERLREGEGREER